MITFRWFAGLAAVLLSVSCLAAGPKGDVLGAQDHALVTRFAGSTLVGYRLADWDQTLLPTSSEVSVDPANKKRMRNPLTVEGKVTKLFYMGPVGKTPLEVFRNHEQALKSAGLKVVANCEKNCSEFWFALGEETQLTEGVKWSEGGVPSATRTSSWPMNTIASYDGRMLHGTLASGGRTVHVLLWTSTAAGAAETNRAGTYLEIVEPKAMTTGQVTVDAKALQASLAADGKVALYGIFFETGKSDLKTESDAQLAQMAALLNSQPALKVFIVGHTDSAGNVDSNLALSLRRAKAVAEVLSSRYKVDMRRLDPRGVANLAPLASNAAEDGRGRNRRVELVVQ
jgi:OOP family OmpA-OmpF porin